ncbi:hypothetical protein F383_35022 [Gossypium arboreum]|uniref:Uncharacterized protein n=1 Tax=Gossypium arboreum TaxID=29729 RepID=A0A0B0N659_GOSAR|nr:hypothetical protein F383_35022 [Gossypium arboreum]
MQYLVPKMLCVCKVILSIIIYVNHKHISHTEHKGISSFYPTRALRSFYPTGALRSF